MSQTDHTTVEERIEELTERVEALERKLDAGETSAVSGGVDRYDGYVLNRIEELGDEPSPRTMVRLYQEAGVRDRSKIKERHRFLKSSGRIDKATDG